MTDRTEQTEMRKARQAAQLRPQRDLLPVVRSRARSFLIPYADKIENHPVYHMEVRRLRNDRPLATLLRYSMIRVGIIGGILVTIWLIVFFSELETGNSAWGYFETHSSDTILKWLLYVGLGASLGLDFSAIIASVGGINRDRTTAIWNLLQVSAIRRFDVIIVKHTIAQIQVWRMVAIIGSVRLATVIILFLYVLGQSLWRDGIGLLLEDLVRALLEQPLETLLSFYILGTAAVVYGTEVLWRVRAVTAMGTAVSSRVGDTTASVLAGIGGIAAMWISQIIVIGVLLWLTNFVAEAINPSDDLGILVMLSGFTTMYAVVTYGYYTGLRAWSLRQATRHAFRE